MPVAHQMFRNGLGRRRSGPRRRDVHSFSAPKGHARHQTRPTRKKVKMIPAHQMVHVSFVARFTPPSWTS